jgi:hypothetical protein
MATPCHMPMFHANALWDCLEMAVHCVQSHSEQLLCSFVYSSISFGLSRFYCFHPATLLLHLTTWAYGKGWPWTGCQGWLPLGRRVGGLVKA